MLHVCASCSSYPLLPSPAAHYHAPFWNFSLPHEIRVFLFRLLMSSFANKKVEVGVAQWMMIIGSRQFPRGGLRAQTSFLFDFCHDLEQFCLELGKHKNKKFSSSFQAVDHHPVYLIRIRGPAIPLCPRHRSTLSFHSPHLHPQQT